MASDYIEQAVRVRLLADSNITSIVGERIYYMEVPAIVTYPYVLIQTISDPDNNMYCGKDGSNPRLQIDSVDENESLTDVKALDKAIRTSMNDFSGTMDGITVYLVERGGFRELREDEKIIRLSRDFIINYER